MEGIAEFLYLISTFLLTILSFLYYGLSFWALLREEETPITKNTSEEEFYPRVSVQIPVYNDRIVERLIKAVLQFDYPNYEVIIADDSTDPTTRSIIDKYSNNPLVKVVRRNSREGFKAGALNNAMKYSTGEIIVVFDSDFVPPPNFLKEIVKPFKDPKIAYVQARWSFENLDENLITTFAGTSLLIYHHLFYPFKNKHGTIYLSGSAMAIRRSALEKVGGWKNGTLAEDGELTMRFASAGYKSLYLPYLRTPNQLPFLLKVFIRQQARWSSGMIEAFLLNWKRILSSKKLSFIQKSILLAIPILNLSYVVVSILILASLLLWAFKISLFSPLMALLVLLMSSGFIVAGYISLKKEGMQHIFPRFLVSTYLLGPLLAITNTVALLKYFFSGISWHVTPKRWKYG